MPFQIEVHPTDRIIEVIYPASPSSDDVSDYLIKMKELIDDQKGPWFCLVDQRLLASLPESLLGQVSVANSYAVLHGMQRSARVVASAESAAQANAIGGGKGTIQVKVKTFVERNAAIAWLKSNTD